MDRTYRFRLHRDDRLGALFEATLYRVTADHSLEPCTHFWRAAQATNYCSVTPGPAVDQRGLGVPSSVAAESDAYQAVFVAEST